MPVLAHFCFVSSHHFITIMIVCHISLLLITHPPDSPFVLAAWSRAVSSWPRGPILVRFPFLPPRAPVVSSPLSAPRAIAASPPHTFIRIHSCLNTNHTCESHRTGTVAQQGTVGQGAERRAGCPFPCCRGHSHSSRLPCPVRIRICVQSSTSKDELAHSA